MPRDPTGASHAVLYQTDQLESARMLDNLQLTSHSHPKSTHTLSLSFAHSEDGIVHLNQILHYSAHIVELLGILLGDLITASSC